MLQIKVNHQEIKALSTASKSEVEMLEPGRFLLRKDDKVFEIFVLAESEDGKEIEIQINQHYYKVSIQNELDQLLTSLGFQNIDFKKGMDSFNNRLVSSFYFIYMVNGFILF